MRIRKWVSALIGVVFLALVLLGYTSTRPTALETGSEESAVVAIVQRFFHAMAAKDVEAFRATMTPDALVYAAPEPPAPLRGRNASADAEFLATTTDILLERMWDPDVRVRGRIAMLWTPYDFWRNGEFSHCGIDVFTLVKTDDGWKISSAVYTVEREGCVPSPLGPPTAEQLRRPT
jgi:hypothetical protein